MFVKSTWLRQALPVAFMLLPLLAMADIAAEIDPETGEIHVTGLDDASYQTFLVEEDLVVLRVSGQNANQSMPLALATNEEGLIIDPRFDLRPGTTYSLSLGSEVVSLTVPMPTSSVPLVSSFSPSQAVIPANTLRIYLTFSEPMARGSLREAISLLRADGTEVVSPFLALGPELWDATQTRVTLLFDPGRIKQGVGPNVSHGAPLVDGENYYLQVGTEMTSASGIALDHLVRVAFRVGPAELRSIDPNVWQVMAPEADTNMPLTLVFDRIMDVGAVQRMITLQGPDGSLIHGTLETDGGGWSVLPDRPWAAGIYTITIDPELEDVSGNAIGQPFDAGAGTIGRQENAVTLSVAIGE